MTFNVNVHRFDPVENFNLRFWQFRIATCVSYSALMKSDHFCNLWRKLTEQAWREHAEQTKQESNR